MKIKEPEIRKTKVRNTLYAEANLVNVTGPELTRRMTERIVHQLLEKMTEAVNNMADYVVSQYNIDYGTIEKNGKTVFYVRMDDKKLFSPNRLYIEKKKK